MEEHWIIQTATTNTTKHPLVLLGDLNVSMKQTWKRNNKQRQEETINLIESLGLTDLSNHFTQRRGWKDWTWSMKNKEGMRVRSVCDYIIAEKRSDFKSFQVKQPRYDGDHRLIKATLSI
jgi:endonuclease/exonuclease/phosphatase family metal-dependent hydrolase